jgi:geranylgeranyl diphosphate synthase type I
MDKENLEEHWHSIIADRGGRVAKQAMSELLNDPDLAVLTPCLNFISANWSDPLRPALIGLSCEAVGGKSEDTAQVAIALSLMNLSFFLWDDAIDKAQTRLFKPTFFGKFGENAAIIVGGLASAKAFIIFNSTIQDERLRKSVSEEIWKLWATMAQAESAALSSRKGTYRARDKLLKIQEEAKSNLSTCLRIGAMIGNGSTEQVLHLGNYGVFLGMIVDIRNDFRVATNLTVELAQKIKTGALPYSLLWAKEHSQVTRGIIRKIREKENVQPNDVAKLVASVLETRIKEVFASKLDKLTKKAGVELSSLRCSEATQTLKSFVEAQPLLFEQTLRCGL